MSLCLNGCELLRPGFKIWTETRISRLFKNKMFVSLASEQQGSDEIFRNSSFSWKLHFTEAAHLVYSKEKVERKIANPHFTFTPTLMVLFAHYHCLIVVDSKTIIQHQLLPARGTILNVPASFGTFGSSLAKTFEFVFIFSSSKIPDSDSSFSDLFPSLQIQQRESGAKPLKKTEGQCISLH